LPVDNEMYHAPGDIWWNDTKELSFLRTSVNPARFPYFRAVITDRLGIDPRGKKTLDIGCGGGLLAEEFARLGCEVTGVDPSAPSLESARAHAARSGLDITYLQAAGEDLPFPEAAFDIVYCCDVLEHVNDLDRVIAETARVLKAGGIYLYDTINRTLVSKLIVVKCGQEWPYTRIMSGRLHDWSMFVKPRELQALMATYGIENRDVAGMKPAMNPLGLLRTVRSYKTGKISYRELSERLVFSRSRDTSMSYMGYGVRRSAPPPIPR
jgi:2-polyprenyl-6-hydroxyphenyl methylase/3-demethylubiquinone-9 3-methyltransferase